MRHSAGQIISCLLLTPKFHCLSTKTRHCCTEPV